MKIQPYVEKLTASPEYKDFKKRYSDAFLAAGFFVLDLEMGGNIHQIDYYIPSEKKFAAFTLDKGVNVQILDTITNKIPEKLDIKTKIDLEALPGILEDEMKNRNITEDIKKIIAVIQNIKGKKIWNINSVLSGMDILKAHIDDSSKTILKMEKTSFIDIMKKIPMEQMQMPQVKEEGSEVAAEEIKRLEELEKQIEKEKSRLKKEVVEKEKNDSSSEKEKNDVKKKVVENKNIKVSKGKKKVN